MFETAETLGKLEVSPGHACTGQVVVRESLSGPCHECACMYLYCRRVAYLLCCLSNAYACTIKMLVYFFSVQARYKQSLDPTVDEVKKLCTSLRRNAKEERVLFHYNGHGVPRPTVNGEIWVFNKVRHLDTGLKTSR